MRNRTAPSGPSRRHGRYPDSLDLAVRTMARDAGELLGQVRAMEAQIDALSLSILQAAWAAEDAKRRRDG